jgi:hypothetical protein
VLPAVKARVECQITAGEPRCVVADSLLPQFSSNWTGIRSRHFVNGRAGEPLVILSIARRRRAVWYQRRRSPARKARSAHSSGSSRNFRRSISRMRLISRSHAKPLAQPPCNSRASARLDFPSARRSISRRASDSGRFSSLQIGTALQCASIEPRSAGSDASKVCLAWG